MARRSCMQILRYFSPSKHYPIYAIKRLHVIMVGCEENVNRKHTAAVSALCSNQYTILKNEEPPEIIGKLFKNHLSVT